MIARPVRTCPYQEIFAQMKRLAGWTLSVPAILLVLLALVLPVALTIGETFTDARGVFAPYTDFMNSSFRRELFDPLTRAMQDGIERAELRQSDSEFYAWIFLGLVNTFVRDRARPAHPSFANDPQLLAPRLVDFFFEGAYLPIT